MPRAGANNREKTTITVTASTVNAKSPGFVLYTHKASLEIGTSGESIKLLPERDFAEEVDPDTFTGLQAEDIRVHEKNWFDCIRTRKTPVADWEIGHRSVTACHLGVIAQRTGRKIRWDAKSERIFGDAEAERMMTKKYREPWGLPKVWHWENVSPAWNYGISRYL